MSEKRIYLHFINKPGIKSPFQDFTLVYDVTPRSTVELAKSAFLEALGETVNAYIFTLGGRTRLETQDGTVLSDDSYLDELVEDREDIFVNILKPDNIIIENYQKLKHGSSWTPSPPASSSSASSSLAFSITTSSSTTSFGRGATLLSGKEIEVFQNLTKAKEYQSKGLLRKARDLYLQSLPIALERKTNDQMKLASQICYQQLGVIFLHNEFYDKAVTQFSKAVAMADAARVTRSAQERKDAEAEEEYVMLLMLLGQAQYGEEDYEAAIDTFERAIDFVSPRAPGDKKKPLTSKPSTLLLDLRVWLARSLYALSSTSKSHGNRQRAVQIYEENVKWNENHAPTLTHYASIAVEMGQAFQAIPYIIRAVVSTHTTTGQEEDMKQRGNIDRETQTKAALLLTKVVTEVGGVKQLLKELGPAANSISALNFLAQTVKDNGAIHASIELYDHAIKMLTQSNPPASLSPQEKRMLSSLVLSQAHTFEVAYQYKEAFLCIKQHLSSLKDLKIADGLLSISEFYQAIQNIQDPSSFALKIGSGKDVPAWKEMPEVWDAGNCQVYVPPVEEEEDKKDEKQTAIKLQDKKDPNTIELTDDTPAYLPQLTEKQKEEQTKRVSRGITNEELNVLALCMTVVKILFVCGGLQPLPHLCSLIEPVRRNRKLHLTVIRNEQAYYSSVAQLLSKVSFPIYRNNDEIKQEPIYFCADSHCLSTAWQRIPTNKDSSSSLLIQPKLVTGLKCWHLRPESRFYPKQNFDFCMRTISPGSTVIFGFGEIDCREGLLAAVEKGKYEKIEDAIKVTVEVYIKVLEEQAKQKKLKAFVCPPPPVLDVTRKTVQLFVVELKRKVQLSKYLKWLEFFDQLLTNDNKLKPEYGLDGTHLSPAFLELLGPALLKHL